MKRSEMLEILDRAIHTSIVDNGEMVPQYDADVILAALEEAGMLPPETDRTKCSDLDIDLPIETNGEYMPDRFQCGWDDE